MIELLRKWVLGVSKPKYIGCTKGRLSITTVRVATGEKEEYDLDVQVSYYMNNIGERFLALYPNVNDAINREVKKGRLALWNEAVVWRDGGSFPEDFIAETDTLMPMLQKLIDRKLLGES
jgi:hypothetical protein